MIIQRFLNLCPPGWTRVSSIDNRFVIGGLTYGVTGGSSTHTHTVVFSQANAPGATSEYVNSGGSQGVSVLNHNHIIPEVTVITEPGSSLPNYKTVVFCSHGEYS